MAFDIADAMRAIGEETGHIGEKEPRLQDTKESLTKTLSSQPDATDQWAQKMSDMLTKNHSFVGQVQVEKDNLNKALEGIDVSSLRGVTGGEAGNVVALPIQANAADG